MDQSPKTQRPAEPAHLAVSAITIDSHSGFDRLTVDFAGTGEPVGLIRRSDTQPSPVGRALIDAVRDVAQQRMAAAAVGEPGAKRASRSKSKSGSGRGRGETPKI